MFPHQTCMITILHDEQKVQFTQASNLPDHHIFKRYRVVARKRIKNCEFLFEIKHDSLFHILENVLLVQIRFKPHVNKIQIHSCRVYRKKECTIAKKKNVNQSRLRQLRNLNIYRPLTYINSIVLIMVKVISRLKSYIYIKMLRINHGLLSITLKCISLNKIEPWTWFPFFYCFVNINYVYRFHSLPWGSKQCTYVSRNYFLISSPIKSIYFPDQSFICNTDLVS